MRKHRLSYHLSYHLPYPIEGIVPLDSLGFVGPFPIRSDEKNHVPFLDAARKKQRQDTIAYYPCSMAKPKRALQNAIASLFDMNPVSWTR